MLSFLIETITVISPIIGAIGAIAAVIQLAYRIKQVIYDLQIKDEKFHLRISHIEGKVDTLKTDIANFFAMSQSRQEAFESRLQQMQTESKETLSSLRSLASNRTDSSRGEENLGR